MTIRKGEPWGVAVDRPDDLWVLPGDRELAAALAAQPGRPLGLCAGDLHRSVGSPPDRTDMQALPIDRLDVLVDGAAHVAVAHVVMRRRWWRGRIVAAMNVDHVGNWKVAPRAHPNDGRFDIVEVDDRMPIRQRWSARGRLVAGTHVPHPDITVRTATKATWTFEPQIDVWIDGALVGRAREVSVELTPDACTITV